MPYRELTMIDVKEVLRRWSAGHGDRKIDRETGIDRKTVGRYTAAAERLGMVRGREMTDDDAHAVAQCVQSRPLVAPSEEWGEVAQHRERIEQWLAGQGEPRPLRLTKVHTLLVRDHGLRASYDTLWRFATQQLGWRSSRRAVRRQPRRTRCEERRARQSSHRHSGRGHIPMRNVLAASRVERRMGKG